MEINISIGALIISGISLFISWKNNNFSKSLGFEERKSTLLLKVFKFKEKFLNSLYQLTIFSISCDDYDKNQYNEIVTRINEIIKNSEDIYNKFEITKYADSIEIESILRNFNNLLIQSESVEEIAKDMRNRHRKDNINNKNLTSQSS